MGVKSALSVRFNTCNEIAYIESGTYRVKCIVKKRQVKFWCYLKHNLSCDSPLGKLSIKARNVNLPYVNYYDSLVELYGSPDQL